MTDTFAPDHSKQAGNTEAGSDRGGDGSVFDESSDEIRYDSVEEALAATASEDRSGEDWPGEGEPAPDSAGDDEAVLDDEEGDDGPAEDDDISVRLNDDEEISLGELRRGYLRQQDYTRKTQELARNREAVEAAHDDYAERSQHLQTAYRNLTSQLQALLPPEPDPALAEIDPATYEAELGVREAVAAQLARLTRSGEQIADEFGEAIAEEGARYRAREDAALIEALPFLADPAHRSAFDAANRETALSFGFGEDEIARTADHRILQLVHYARIGRHAEETGRDVARRFAGTPRNGRRGQPATGQRNGSSAAMRRLIETGSFEDAMRVDVG